VLLLIQATVGGKRRMTLDGQSLAVMALALPAAMGVALGSAPPRLAAMAWAATSLFYVGAVFNVHLLLAAPRQVEAKVPTLVQPAARADLVCLASVLAGLEVLGDVQGGRTEMLALAALPALARVAAGLYWVAHPARLKTVGLVETAFTLWFTLCAARWLGA
jgi:hypothetical protein